MQREPNAPVAVPDAPVLVAQEPAAGPRPPSPMRIGLDVLVRRHRSSWPGPMFQHLDEAFGPLRACPSRGFHCLLPLAVLHPRVGLVYVDARYSYGPQSNRSLRCGPAPVGVDMQPTYEGFGCRRTDPAACRHGVSRRRTLRKVGESCRQAATLHRQPAPLRLAPGLRQDGWPCEAFDR